MSYLELTIKDADEIFAVTAGEGFIEFVNREEEKVLKFDYGSSATCKEVSETLLIMAGMIDKLAHQVAKIEDTDA